MWDDYLIHLQEKQESFEGGQSSRKRENKILRLDAETCLIQLEVKQIF